MNEPRLIHSIKPRTFSVITALVGVLFGLASYLSFIFCFPLAMAAFTLLFIYEPQGGRVLSYAAPALLLALGALLFYEYLPLLAALLLSALLISVFYKKGWPKFDAAVYLVGMMLITALFVLLLTAGNDVGAWYPQEAIAYYTEMLSSAKAELLTNVEQMVKEYAMADTLSGEYLSYAQQTVDTFFSLIPSMAAVIAFATVGIALKVLCAVLRRVDEDRGETAGRWRFTAPVVFAYFYIALFVCNLFSGNGMFFTVVNNLYILFMVMFAYIGWKYLRFMMARSRRMRRYRTLLIILAVFFIGVAVQLLAIEGTLAVITAHRMNRNRNGGAP